VKTLPAILFAAALGIVVALGGFLGAQVWAQAGDLREHQVCIRELDKKVTLILRKLDIPYGD